MTNLFRIGGVYRDEDGNLNRLYADAPGLAKSVLVRGYGEDPNHSSVCRLLDGVDPTGECYSLLPGELHLKDGEWVPVEEKPQQSELTQAKAEPDNAYGWLADLKTEPKRAPLDWNKPTPFNNFEGYEVKCGVGLTTATTATRSPLTTLGDGTDPAHASAYLKF